MNIDCVMHVHLACACIGPCAVQQLARRFAKAMSPSPHREPVRAWAIGVQQSTGSHTRSLKMRTYTFAPAYSCASRIRPESLRPHVRLLILFHPVCSLLSPLARNKAAPAKQCHISRAQRSSEIGTVRSHRQGKPAFILDNIIGDLYAVMGLAAPASRQQACYFVFRCNWLYDPQQGDSTASLARPAQARAFESWMICCRLHTVPCIRRCRRLAAYNKNICF